MKLSSSAKTAKRWTADTVLSTVNKENIKFIRLQFVDLLGMPRNLTIPQNLLKDALENGVPFDASSIIGCANIEESDKVIRPLPATFCILPESIEKRKTAKISCDIYEQDGKTRFPGDVRYVLQQILQKAEKHGFRCNTGSECEFFLFQRDGNGPTLTPHDQATYFDLSHRDLAETVRADIAMALQHLGLIIYTTHHEVAPGQQEINFNYSDPLTTAERVVMLKYASKIIASHHGLYASFMPKPLFGTNGSGMHTHLSLSDAAGKNVFFDPKDQHKLSPLAHQFIAGLLTHSREMCAVLNPTVNSFKRLVPGYEAPTYICWANRNRSSLIRIPANRGQATRIELRNPDVACNPFLAYTVMIAAGFDGINHKLQPPNPVERNIYELTAQERDSYGIGQLPESLGHALEILRKSAFIKDALGSNIYENFMKVKREEWEDYQMQVTQWETDRYFHVL
jgi:glutamine synthetase